MGNRLENPPLYQIGQEVEVDINTVYRRTGNEYVVNTTGFIGAIAAVSPKSETPTEADTYKYTIYETLPNDGENGSLPLADVLEADIVIVPIVPEP